MFVHHVFFWIKNDLTSDALTKFENGVKTLPSIEPVKFGDIGKPAGTNRTVIERSYSYSLLLVFETKLHMMSIKFTPFIKNLLQIVLICGARWLFMIPNR